MTAIETPLMVLPARDLQTSPQWEVGDTVIASGKRWIVRSLNRDTGRVYLVAANTTNHAIGWSTTLDMIPEKTA